MTTQNVEDQAGTERPQIRRIVVGVDGSDHSVRALQWAAQEATHHGASLLAVTAWQQATAGAMPPSSGTPATRTADLDLGGTTAQGLRDTVAAAGVEAETSVEHGGAAKVLIERSAGADLLVVGSRGHGGFVGMLVGSVVQHVTAHAECPVVIVR